MRAKLIIQVQLRVSAEVVELCHAGSENTVRTVAPAVGGSWWGAVLPHSAVQLLLHSLRLLHFLNCQNLGLFIRCIKDSGILHDGRLRVFFQMVASGSFSFFLFFFTTRRALRYLAPTFLSPSS